MLEVIFEPLRRVIGLTERDLANSVHEVRDVEANMLGAVEAIEMATHSIEHHVEVIEGLATSIDPLRAAVDRLTEQVSELVAALRPLTEAEHEIERVGRFFGRHRDRA